MPLSLTFRNSMAPHHLSGLHLPFTSLSSSFWYWGAQNWRQHFWCNLKNAKGKEIITSVCCDALPNAAQDAISLQHRLGALLARVPQGLFCRATFSPAGIQPTQLHGVIPSQVQDVTVHQMQILPQFGQCLSKTQSCHLCVILRFWFQHIFFSGTHSALGTDAHSVQYFFFPHCRQ